MRKLFKLILSLTVTILLNSIAVLAKTDEIKIGSIKKDGMECTFNSDGSIKQLLFATDDERVKDIPFTSDEWRGPRFDIGIDIKQENDKNAIFKGSKDGIVYKISYSPKDNGLNILVEVENTTDVEYSPEKLPFNLGVDTWLDKFPEWNSKYLPTFFRCEKSNMWGYMMSPQGDILSITSQDPVASYLVNYEQAMYAHCIHTVTFDLLCQPPLPSHHPKLTSIAPKSKQKWEFDIKSLKNIDEILPSIASATAAPIIELEKHSLEPSNLLTFSVMSSSPSTDVKILLPSGKTEEINGCKAGEKYTFDKTHAYGFYQIEACSDNGKYATASFYVRPSWSWYLDRSRLESLRFVPRSDPNNDSCETWYNLLAFYLAEKYSPDKALLFSGNEILQQVIDTLFVEKDGLMFTKTYPERVQNVAAMVSILSDKYHVTKDPKTLDYAVKMANYILSRQHEDGYYGGYGMKHYTSVLYIGKAVLELMDEIKPLTVSDAKWKKLYDKYNTSVERAMDELVERGRNISTEGNATFEDGAVASSALQLLNFALRQEDPAKREVYRKAGMQYLTDHACLARLLDPDCRSRGATARFWECWGDIQTPIQVMLSPHGWSAWRLYASYYSYLLSGKEKDLTKFMDAMGTCTQLMEFPNGVMRYSFTPDPQIMAGEIRPDSSSRKGKFYPGIMGASYNQNIGEWFGKNNKGQGYLDQSSWDWCGDGPSFEIIKVMEESVVPNAFVLEREDGSILAYNCVAIREDGKIIVTPSEDIVSNVHVSLSNPTIIEVCFVDGDKVSSHINKMSWIRK